MKSLENIQLTNNFHLYEFIEGVVMPRPSIKMNWEEINAMSQQEKEQFVQRYRDIAQLMQQGRDNVNRRFKARNNNITIGIRITSGHRAVKWEVGKGRGSNSRHSLGATDFSVINVNDDTLYAEIMEFLWGFFDKALRRLGGVGTYKADAKQQADNPMLKKRPFRFIHIDMLAKRATRWHYKAP